jgi:Family of unknown function (DUF5662)
VETKTDTERHIERVNFYLNQIIADLQERGVVHDASKLVEPEVSGFDKIAVERTNVKHGTPEYSAMMESIQPIINHHYLVNDHHPEHFATTLNEDSTLKELLDETKTGLPLAAMDLRQVMEMLCDWKAASERGQQSPFLEGMEEVSKERFGIEPQLFSILKNTVRAMGWQ